MELFILLLILLFIYIKLKPKKKIALVSYSIKGYTDLKKGDFNFTPGGIPKIIIKTSWHRRDSMPAQMVVALEKTKNVNPGYTIYYFDNDEVDQFMYDFSRKYNGFYNVYNCYKKVVPGAFKADLFRVCCLYEFGGCYSDIGHISLVSFDEICEDANIVLVNDRNIIIINDLHINPDFSGVHNALMCTVPQHPFFKEIIEKTCSNITSKYYGENALDVTGPTMIGKVFNCYFGNICDYINKDTMGYGRKNYKCTNCKLKILKFVNYPMKRTDTFYIIHNNKKLIQTKFDDYYNVMYYSKKTPRYGELWNEKKIYT